MLHIVAEMRARGWRATWVFCHGERTIGAGQKLGRLGFQTADLGGDVQFAAGSGIAQFGDTGFQGGDGLFEFEVRNHGGCARAAGVWSMAQE
jgi:hypothetical protein